MNRQTVSTGTEWESHVGYSRAVRLGPHVYVSGTTAIGEEGAFAGSDDPYKQTIQALENIEKALQGVNTGMSDVVRSRMYVTDIDNWEEIGRAHGEVFSEICPATSMVEVNQLIEPEMLVEIEVDALVTSDNTDTV